MSYYRKFSKSLISKYDIIAALSRNQSIENVDFYQKKLLKQGLDNRTSQLLSRATNVRQKQLINLTHKNLSDLINQSQMTGTISLSVGLSTKRMDQEKRIKFNKYASNSYLIFKAK